MRGTGVTVVASIALLALLATADASEPSAGGQDAAVAPSLSAVADTPRVPSVPSPKSESVVASQGASASASGAHLVAQLLPKSPDPLEELHAALDSLDLAIRGAQEFLNFCDREQILEGLEMRARRAPTATRAAEIRALAARVRAAQTAERVEYSAALEAGRSCVPLYVRVAEGRAAPRTSEAARAGMGLEGEVARCIPVVLRHAERLKSSNRRFSDSLTEAGKGWWAH